LRGTEKSMSRTDSSKAARKAFEAYERAVAAAEKMIAAGPPFGLGTTVMTGVSHGFTETLTCFECKGRGEKGWKFCAHCGAEIVRFDSGLSQRIENATVVYKVEENAIPKKASDMAYVQREVTVTRK
jgi:hypothetical protein